MKKHILASIGICALALNACAAGTPPRPTEQLKPIEPATIVITEAPSPANPLNATLPPLETKQSDAILETTSQVAPGTLEPNTTDEASRGDGAETVIARFSVHLSGAVKDEFNSENGLFAADYMPPASQSLSGGPVGSSRAPGIHTLRFSDAKEQFELRIQMSGIIAQGDYTAAVNALGVTLMVSGDSRSFNVLQSGQLTLDSVNRDQTQISGHFEFKVAPQSDPDTVVTITGAFTELPIEQVQNGATASTTVPGSDSTGS